MPSTQSFMELKEKNRVLNYRERAGSAPVIESLPLVAKIEVTNRCNLRCVMCREKQPEVRELSGDLFDKLEPVFPTLLSAYLYGVGEVLLYPAAMGLVARLQAYEINVGLITNGLLITPVLAEQWVKDGLYKLSISIDSASAEQYERIRRGASFDRLLRNIALVQELKKRYATARPRITFNVVAMRDTIGELAALVDLAARYGAEEVIVNDLIVFFDALRDQVVDYHDPLCHDNFLKAQERARLHGITLALPGPYCFQQLTKGSVPHNAEKPQCGADPTINPCTEPWSGFWLTSEGVVTPCCYWFKPMGDLRQHSFSEIWNNQQYQSLRTAINTPRRAAQCRHCVIAGMEQRKPNLTS